MKDNDLIETLKKLIQGDKVLVRQMKRTIAVVDRKLELHRKLVESGKNAQSDRDKT